MVDGRGHLLLSGHWSDISKKPVTWRPSLTTTFFAYPSVISFISFWVAQYVHVPTYGKSKLLRGCGCCMYMASLYNSAE
jgi:hypothetical protein